MFTVVTCSHTLNFYCDTISRHAHKQLSCTKLLPQCIANSAINTIIYAKIVQGKFHNCFCTNTLYFNWPNFLSMGIVDTSFQSDGTGKYAMPIRHLSFHFTPLAVSYGLFHGEIKDNWSSPRLNPKVHSSYFLGNST